MRTKISFHFFSQLIQNVVGPVNDKFQTRTFWLLFSIPGVMGFLIGAIGFGFLHPAVESAQTLAGIVPYPKTNPFAQYHLAVFTLWHPAVALLLKMGTSERLIHHLISGILGSLNYMAVAFIVFSLSRRPFIAIATPPLLHFAGLWANPITYGLAWISDFSYGISGLALSGLTIGLFASGYKRVAFFLLGLLPAIHPALGAHLHLIFGLAWLLYYFQSKDRISRNELLSYLAGLAGTLLSLGFYFWRRDLPPAPPVESIQILQAFYRDWDCHRLPIHHSPLRSFPTLLGYPPQPGAPLGMVAILFVLITAAFTFFLQRSEKTKAANFATTAFLSASFFALLAIPISRLNPENVPTPIWIAMPQRWVNFPIFFAGAWTIGILFKFSPRWWTAPLLGMFCFLLLFQQGSPFGDFSPVWTWVLQAKVSTPPWVVFPISLFLMASLSLLDKFSKLSINPFPIWQKLFVFLGSCLLFLVLSTAWYSEIGRAQNQAADSFSRTQNYRHEPFWAWVHNQHTMIAPAASIGRVQALSGSPILLEPVALDTLSMTPSSGVYLNEILKDVYGTDLLHVPEEARSTAMVPPMANQRAFENRTRGEWALLSRRYGFGLAITPASWALKLPIGQSNSALIAWVTRDSASP